MSEIIWWTVEVLLGFNITSSLILFKGRKCLVFLFFWYTFCLIAFSTMEDLVLLYSSVVESCNCHLALYVNSCITECIWLTDSIFIFLSYVFNYSSSSSSNMMSVLFVLFVLSMLKMCSFISLCHPLGMLSSNWLIVSFFV